MFLEKAEAKLIFERKPDSANQIEVFLRIVNRYDSNLSWVCNSFTGIEAELLDAEGKPVVDSATAGSMSSNPVAYSVPYGSRLDWLISHRGGVMGRDPTTKEYLLTVGGHYYLIPKDHISSYQLRVVFGGCRGSDQPITIAPISKSCCSTCPRKRSS